MSGIGKFKLADALPRPPRKDEARKGGKPTPTQSTAAEQVREARESEGARAAELSSRERMVGIGRGNQQAGRQGQS